MNNGEGIPLSSENAEYVKGLQDSLPAWTRRSGSEKKTSGVEVEVEGFSELCDGVLNGETVDQVMKLIKLLVDNASSEASCAHVAAVLSRENRLHDLYMLALNDNLSQELEEKFISLLFLVLTVHPRNGSLSLADLALPLSNVITPRLSLYTAKGHQPANLATLTVLLRVLERSAVLSCNFSKAFREVPVFVQLLKLSASNDDIDDTQRHAAVAVCALLSSEPLSSWPAGIKIDIRRMIGAADLLLQQTVNNSPKPLGICGSKACLHTLAGREVTTALISDTLSGSLLFSEALAAFYGILSCAVSADQPTASIFAETGLRHVSAFFDSPSFPLKRAQLSYVFELLHSLLTVTACHGAVSKHFEDFSAVLRSTFDCIDTSNVPASVIDVLGILCSKGQFRATASGLGVAKLLSRIINASPKDDVVLRCLQILSQLNGNAIAPYADKLLDLFGSHVGKVGITALYIVLLVVSSECKYSKSSLYSKTIQCMQSVLDGPVSDNNTDALSLCLETFVRLTLDSPAFCEMFCYGCVLPLLRTPLRLKTAEFLLHMLDIDTTGSAFGKIEKVLPGNLAASISLEKSKALSERKKEWQRFSEKTESALDHLLHKRLVSLQGIKQEWEANSTAISQLQENHKAEIDAAYSQHIKSILSMEESLLRPVVIAAYEHEVEQGRIFVYDTQVLRQLVDSNSEQRRCARADLREQMNSLHFTTMTPTVSEERYKDNLTLKGVMPQVGMKYDRSNWQLPRVMQDSYLETLHKKHESQISYLNVSTAEFLSTHINKNLHADKLETAVNVTISLLQTPVDAASELAEQQSAQCELAGAPEQSLEQQQHIISLKERKLDHIKTLLHPYELSRERQLNTISELRREASEAMEKRMEKVAEVLEHVEQEDTKARIRTRSVLGAISEQEEVECRGLSKRYRGDLARLIADHGIKEQISTKELIIEVEKEKRTDLLSKRASAATFFEAVPSATGSQDIQRWTAKRLRSQNRDTTAVTQAAQYRSSHDASDITAPLITAVTRNENSDTTQHVLRMFERLCIEDEAMKQRKLEHSTHLSQQCRYKMRSVEESFERDMAAFVAAEVEIVQKCAAWHQYLSGFHTRLNTMIATDTARRKDLYKDEIDRAAEECSVITSCNELNPLDHPLIVSHVIQAWSLCRWVCNADMMREEMGRFQQYNPGAHVNIEERVRVAEARQRLVHGMKDKDTFYMAILEMLEEERCLALEAVQNAGGEAKELDALTALIATNARYDTLCDLAGIVTWGNSSLLNERIKDIRVTSLQGTPIHDCAAAYGITVAMTIALQETHESTQQNFEEFKKTIESLELEEASKAELQAVALFRSDDPEQKQSLQTQLDTVVSKRKELLQKQTAFTEAVIGIVNEGSLQREMAIKDLAQLLENAENLSQQDFEKMIEDEEWRFAEKEAAVEMKISDLEKQHDKQEISNGLCDLEAREIDLRKQIAASQLRRPLQTSDSTMQMNKYALQRSESLLTARKKAAASKASYQKKLAEIEKKVKAVVIRISGERSIVPDEQLQAEHENERMKLKVKLLRNQAADSLLKAEAEGNFQRRLSVSILQPQDKPSTRQSLDADISRRMHERAEYEYRLANRQQLEQDERTLLDEAKHVTDLKRVERERAAAVSNIRKTAPVSFKELCAKYMKNGKMTLDTKAFDKALQSQAGRTKECLEIEGAAIERKRSIIEKIRSSSTVPPVVKKLQDLLTCEESRLQGVVEFANAEEKEHTMLKAMLEKGEVDLNAADKCYKQTQNSVSEYEKLAVAERSVILDEVRCAHEQAAEKLHKEVREAILKEVVSERCKDEEEAVFLEEQIQTAQRDPAQMQELITAAKDIKEGDNHYLYNLDALKKEFSEREEQRALLLKRHAIEGDRLTKIKVAMKKQNDFDTKSINAELNTIIAEAEKALQKQHEEEEEKEQITLQKAKEALEEEQRNEEEEKKRKKDEKAPKRVIRAAPVQAKYAAAVDDGEWMYNLDALEKEFQERKKIRKKEVEHSTTRHKEEKQEVRAQVTQIAQAKASLGQLEKPSAPLPPPLQPVDTDKAEAMARQKLESKELENMWEAKKKEQEAGEKILLEAQESIKSIEREVTEAVSRKKDELNESDRQQKEAIAEEIDKANDSEETLEARKERFKDQEWMYDKEALDLEFSKRETKRCLKADIILDLHKREVMQQCTMLEGEDTARHTHTDMAEVVAEQEEDLDVVAAETAKRKAAADYDIAVKTFADTDRGCASFRIKRFNNLKEMRRAAESLDRYANNTTILWRPKMRNLVKLQLMLGRMNEEHRKEIIAGIRNGQEISRDTLSAKLSLSCTEDDIQHIATAIKQAQQEVQADAQMRAAAIEEQSKKIASDEKKALEKEQEAVKTVTSTPVDGEWMYNLDALEEDFKTREVQRKRRRILAQARADKTRGDGKAWLQQTFYRGDWMYDISTMVAEEQRMEALQMREDHDIEDSGRRGLREHLSSMYRIDNGSHEAEMGLKELEEEELLIKTRREAFEAELAEQHNNITEHVKYLQSRAEELKAFTWPPQENEPKEKEARVASADRENAFHRLRRESKAFHLTKQFSLQKAKRRHKAKKELLSLSGLISRAKARDAAVLQHRQHTEASFHIENLDKADSTVISLQRRRVQTNCNALQRAIVDAARAWYEVDIMRLSILRREEVQVAHDNYELCTSVDSCGTQLVAKPATSAALLHYMTESSVSSANNAGKAAHGALTLALQLRTAPVLLSALKVHELSSRLISSAEITLEDIKSVLDAQDYTLQEESKIVTVDLTEQCKEATALLEALDTNGCKAPLSIRTALLGKTSFRAVVPSAHERAVEQIEEALVKATVDEVDMDVYEAVLGDRLCQLSEHRETMMELDVCKCKVKLLKLLSGSEAEVFENTSGKIACRKYKRHETSSVFEKKLAKLQAEVYWHGKNDSFRPATELSMKNTPSPDMPPLLTYDSAMFYKLSLKESEATIKELIKEEVEAIQQEMRKEWDVSWACDAAMVELREQRHKKRTTLWSTTNIKRLQDRAVVGMTLNCGFGRCIANECNVMIAEAQGDHEAASDHRRQLDANVLGMQHKLLEEWVTEAEQWNDAVKLADIVPEHPDMTERTWPAAYCSYLDGMLEASCKTEDTIFQDLWNSRLTLMRTPGYLYDSAVHGIDALTRYYGAKLVKTISLSMDVVHVIELWKEEVTSFSISPTMLHSAPVAGYRMRDACIEEASLSTKHRRPSSCISDEELTMLEALRAHAAQDIKAASSPQLTLFEEGRKYFESLAATKLAMTIGALESGWLDYTEGLWIKALRLIEQRSLSHNKARAQYVEIGRLLSDLGSTMSSRGRKDLRKLWTITLNDYMSLERVPGGDEDLTLKHEVVMAIRSQRKKERAMWAGVKQESCSEIIKCIPDCLKDVQLPEADHEANKQRILNIEARSKAFDAFKLVHTHCSNETFDSAVTALSHALVSPVETCLDFNVSSGILRSAVAASVLVLAASVKHVTSAIEDATGLAICTLWQLTYQTCEKQEHKERIQVTTQFIEGSWKGFAMEAEHEEEATWKVIEAAGIHERAALQTKLEERYLNNVRIAQEAFNEEQDGVRNTMASEHDAMAVQFQEESRRMAVETNEELGVYLILEELEDAVAEYVAIANRQELRLAMDSLLSLEGFVRTIVSEQETACLSEMLNRLNEEASCLGELLVCHEARVREEIALVEACDWQDLVDVMLQGGESSVIKQDEQTGRLETLREENAARSVLMEHNTFLRREWLNEVTLRRLVTLTTECHQRMLFMNLRNFALQKRRHREEIMHAIEGGLEGDESSARNALTTNEEGNRKMLLRSEQHNRIMKKGYNSHKKKGPLVPLTETALTSPGMPESPTSAPSTASWFRRRLSNVINDSSTWAASPKSLSGLSSENYSPSHRRSLPALSTHEPSLASTNYWDRFNTYCLENSPKRSTPRVKTWFQQ